MSEHTFGPCYRCRAGEHGEACIGVPCECECERPPRTDAEIVGAFVLFLDAVGPAIPGRTVVKDTQAMLAALDVLDPELAERVAEKIATANDA